MKSTNLNLLLIITSLLGYLEWGGGNHIFLFTGEIEIIQKLFTNPTSIIHPFTLIPLMGQILLLITLFQKTPSKILTYISIAGLSLLLGFMFIIGLMSMNFKIIISTIPFIVVSILAIRHYRKIK
ncbi:MAG: hypothetical protein C0448_10085 [Sphingobacteriaceae bacterium]|nr:hypothetical protein [Sphingobacteriaceae bacterium]